MSHKVTVTENRILQSFISQAAVRPIIELQNYECHHKYTLIEERRRESHISFYQIGAIIAILTNNEEVGWEEWRRANGWYLKQVLQCKDETKSKDITHCNSTKWKT